MCRSIKTLRGAEQASDADIEAAALQFVRKLSGFRQPSRANAEAFEAAVKEISAVSKRMLATLPPVTPKARPADSAQSARKSRAASARPK